MATLEQMARAFARKYPTPRSHRNGGDLDWDQDCGAVMSRFCLEFGKEPTGDVRSAWVVWKRTPTAGTDASKAPAGAFHFWDIGGIENGHVGLDVYGGGSVVFMGNSSVNAIEGATGLGFQSVAGYGKHRPNARYVGWTMTYANGSIGSFDKAAAPAASPAPSSSWAFNPPSAALQKRVQAALKARKRYSGAVDGVWGVNTVKGIQTSLKGVGYTGPVDGIAGPETCRLVQVYAQRFGSYTGPVDRVLGPNSWAGFALGIERP